MPILSENRLLNFEKVRITKMTMPQLIRYEQLLWQWMDKTGGSATIANQLNLIYREVEWRAQEREWHRAAHSRQRLRTLG